MAEVTGEKRKFWKRPLLWALALVVVGGGWLTYDRLMMPEPFDTSGVTVQLIGDDGCRPSAISPNGEFVGGDCLDKTAFIWSRNAGFKRYQVDPKNESVFVQRVNNDGSAFGFFAMKKMSGRFNVTADSQCIKEAEATAQGRFLAYDTTLDGKTTVGSLLKDKRSHAVVRDSDGQFTQLMDACGSVEDSEAHYISRDSRVILGLVRLAGKSAVVRWVDGVPEIFAPLATNGPWDPTTIALSGDGKTVLIEGENSTTHWRGNSKNRVISSKPVWTGDWGFSYSSRHPSSPFFGLVRLQMNGGNLITWDGQVVAGYSHLDWRAGHGAVVWTIRNGRSRPTLLAPRESMAFPDYDFRDIKAMSDDGRVFVGTAVREAPFSAV